MSTWLSHRKPRYLVKLDFCAFLWRCFWKREAFASVEWVKPMALPTVGGHHPIPGLARTKRCRKARFSLYLTEQESWSLPAVSAPVLRPSDPTRNSHHRLSGSWALEIHTGFPGLQHADSRSWDLPHNCMSQHHIVDLFKISVRYIISLSVSWYRGRIDTDIDPIGSVSLKNANIERLSWVGLILSGEVFETGAKGERCEMSVDSALEATCFHGFYRWKEMSSSTWAWKRIPTLDETAAPAYTLNTASWSPDQRT